MRSRNRNNGSAREQIPIAQEKMKARYGTMADRKLYHLINGEFVYDGMPSMRIPAYEEVNAHIAMLRDVGFFDDPIAESVPAWDGLSNGKRTTEKQASLYDAMIAEIENEKNNRMRKYLRKHEIRNDGKPVRKEKRKSYEKEKCYSCDPWHGLDTVRKYREIEAEKADARDYEIELRNIADDAKRDAIDAEIREWEQRIAHEQKMRKLNDWLKYA